MKDARKKTRVSFSPQYWEGGWMRGKHTTSIGHVTAPILFFSVRAFNIRGRNREELFMVMRKKGKKRKKKKELKGESGGARISGEAPSFQIDIIIWIGEISIQFPERPFGLSGPAAKRERGKEKKKRSSSRGRATLKILTKPTKRV